MEAKVLEEAQSEPRAVAVYSYSVGQSVAVVGPVWPVFYDFGVAKIYHSYLYSFLE